MRPSRSWREAMRGWRPMQRAWGVKRRPWYGARNQTDRLSGCALKLCFWRKPRLRLAPFVLVAASRAFYIRWYVRKALETVRIGVDAGSYLSPRPRTTRDDHAHGTPLASGHNSEFVESPTFGESDLGESMWISCVIHRLVTRSLSPESWTACHGRVAETLGSHFSRRCLARSNPVYFSVGDCTSECWDRGLRPDRFLTRGSGSRKSCPHWLE